MWLALLSTSLVRERSTSCWRQMIMVVTKACFCLGQRRYSRDGVGVQGKSPGRSPSPGVLPASAPHHSQKSLRMVQVALTGAPSPSPSSRAGVARYPPSGRQVRRAGIRLRPEVALHGACAPPSQWRQRCVFSRSKVSALELCPEKAGSLQLCPLSQLPFRKSILALLESAGTTTVLLRPKPRLNASRQCGLCEIGPCSHQPTRADSLRGLGC
jgi:hypothetical protein